MKRRLWLGACALLAYSAGSGFAAQGVLAAAAGQALGAAPSAQFLALFPLGIVAFPGEAVLLHIFEPRYRQLITDSAESGISFGIVTLVKGGGSSIGTEMKLTRILQTDASGNMDIEVRGVRVFQLQSFQPEVPGKLYSGGQVVFVKNSPRVDTQIQTAVVQLYNPLQQQSGLGPTLSEPYAENLSFLIGHYVGLSRAQELRMLSMPAEYDRQAYLLQHLLQTR